MSWQNDLPDIELHKLARKIQTAIFEGDYATADAVVEKYKADHGDVDPHARLLMAEATSSSNLLSHQSYSTCLDDLYEQRNRRTAAWFKHTPLDIQLNIVQMEIFGRHLQRFPLDTISFSQWHDLLDAPNELEYFQHSSLRNIKEPKKSGSFSTAPKPPTKTPAQQLAKSREVIASGIRAIAGECLNYGLYDKFNEVMTLGRISPWEATSSFYLHHRSSNSTGWVHAELKQPIPFWAVGIFNPTTSDEYWEIMAKHGGPSTPFVPGRVLHRAPRALKGKSYGKRLCSAPKDWTNPLDWLVPSSTISRLLLDPSSGDYISNCVDTSLSAWRQHSLSSFQSSLPANKQASSPVPRTRIM